MGKWAALKGTLKPLPVAYDEGADYEAKVVATRSEYQDRGLQDLADIYNGLRDQKEEAEAALKELNAQLDGIEQLLATRMEDQGLSNFKLAQGGQFILKDEPHTTVKDKTAVREWFIEQGMGEILSPPWTTLNALVKGILEQPIDPTTGQPRAMPPGIDIYIKTSVQRRKK